MPEQDGLATLRELHRDFPEAKVICMSGGGELFGVDFLKTATLLGAAAVLHKPIGQAALLEAVREALLPASE